MHSEQPSAPTSWSDVDTELSNAPLKMLIRFFAESLASGVLSETSLPATTSSCFAWKLRHCSGVISAADAAKHVATFPLTCTWRFVLCNMYTLHPGRAHFPEEAPSIVR